MKQEWLVKSVIEKNNESSSKAESSFKTYIIDILKLITTSEHELILKVNEIWQKLGMNNTIFDRF